MKKSPVLLLGLLLLFPAVPMAADEASFEGGQEEVIVDLVAPGYEATVNLSIPAGYYATNATMKVTGMAAENNISAFAENVSITLDNSTIWAFRQVGFGPLGKQDRFSTGAADLVANFSSNGGSKKGSITLPYGADVTSAVLRLTEMPKGVGQEIANITGTAENDVLGQAVSDAGDLNQDGYDDVIIGGESPHAYILFGGKEMDSTVDITLTGDADAWEYGYSVSGVGDFNNDGYPDVMVSAPYTNNYDGRAYLYYGGENINSTPDMIFDGSSGLFGESVSGAGDINADGYPDIIIGACHNGSNTTGCADVFLGGPEVNNKTDLKLMGEAQYDDFGCSVSSAGDVNNDGFDDIIVGAFANDAGGDGAGRAYIYYSGTSLDDVPDVVMTGNTSKDYFGYSVSDAGDVNDDGYDDVIVGAYYYDPPGKTNAGQAYIYYGGQVMDNVADVILTGAAGGDLFGWSVSSAGDSNNDGYDDVIVGAQRNSDGGNNAGQVYVYYGGRDMDNIPDMTYISPTAGALFGMSVSGAGDVNDDGFDEVVIGASWYGVAVGRAYVYSANNVTVGIKDISLQLGSKQVWGSSGYFNGTALTKDFAGEIQEYMGSGPAVYKDGFGNQYVEIPVDVSGKSGGALKLSEVQIYYNSSASIQNFTTLLNVYLDDHQSDLNIKGNIDVPIRIRSQIAGRLKLSYLDIRISQDLPPSLVRDIDDVEILENSWNSTLIDLYTYFQDDLDPDIKLTFSVVSTTNSTFVVVRPKNNRYLAADAFTGEANDNWTGTVEVVVACTDHRGHTTESNEFTIFVKNVNDEPVITSTPISMAEAAVPYRYNVMAVDGDNDRLEFSLIKAPANMTIDNSSGEISWFPRAKGNFDVVIAVSDGTVSVQQAFTVIVPNKKPRITSTPVLNGSTGARYTYPVTAEDDNLDALTFSVTSKIVGMEIGASTGIIAWTPEYVNNYDVVVEVSDGEATAMQEFTVKVTQGNRAPKFISIPVKAATVSVPYDYQARAIDEDKDEVSFSLVEPPAGMTIEAGKVSWTPSAAGSFTVKIKASDGRGGEKLQEFVVEVKDKLRPTVLVQRPAANENVKGKFTVSGTAVKGTLEVAGVQVRVDGGDWQDVTGKYTWQYGLDTTKLKNGKHALEARAFDGKDYSEILKVDFTVDNQKTQAKGLIPMMDGWVLILLLAAAGALVSVRRQKGI